MENGDRDHSTNAIILNSPKINDTPPEYNDIDKETISHLPSKFSQGALNSALAKETKSKNESRRVSFPEDDKIISGYGEPRNPWAQAKSTSTEELIQAYTQSCQHWGVKPITKLLVQLQEIKDFSVRTHSLTLKGEKLDSKVVETLEAVFKRVQFVIMDLEATSLDEDAAAALFDMIEYYESAVNVLVGFNKNLGTRGWQAAAHMMRKMSCLRLFDGHGVPLTEQAVPFVGRALRLSSTLVTLHLEGAALTGRPIMIIVAALRMNYALRELFLADNRLTSTDALQIANLLKFNISLQLLDIRNNLIQDAGLSHLCVGLMNQPSNSNSGNGLHTLVLWNNQISYQSMPKLSAALKRTTSLTTLNLGQNVLGDDGASRLKEGLLQNRSLLRLGMVGTKMTCEGAIALAEFLAESPRIIRLDMRNNDVRVGGLMALSLAFKINLSLLRLDIDKPSSKETLKELVEKQESLLRNIVEYSDRNKQLALQRLACVQMQKNKKKDDDRNAGLRYMDMTNAAGASTSQNNNCNKSETAHQVMVTSSQVDDSPINSPELLPAHSVSYHQVSPVMFSSSEMQKRAELAKMESQVEDSIKPGQPISSDAEEDDSAHVDDADFAETPGNQTPLQNTTDENETLSVETSFQNTTAENETLSVETSLQNTAAENESFSVETSLQNTTAENESFSVETSLQNTTAENETLSVETSLQNTTAEDESFSVETPLQNTTAENESFSVETSFQNTTAENETLSVETSFQNTTAEDESFSVETPLQNTTAENESFSVETSFQNITAENESFSVETPLQNTTAENESFSVETPLQNTTAENETLIAKTDEKHSIASSVNVEVDLHKDFASDNAIAESCDSPSSEECHNNTTGTPSSCDEVLPKQGDVISSTQSEHELESNVTVTHFDLELFPKD